MLQNDLIGNPIIPRLCPGLTVGMVMWLGFNALQPNVPCIEQLCFGYKEDIQHSPLPSLIFVANFFLNFYVFTRFERVTDESLYFLTLLFLSQNGYEIGKYISLEKLIENNKNDYYRVLGESSEGWYVKSHKLVQWWNDFLSILKSAYQELKERVELSTEGDNKSAIL